MTTAERIGAAIRGCRKANSMTLEQLAEYIGTAPSYVGAIERGQRNVTIRTLEKIANVFDLDLFDLIRLGANKNEAIKDIHTFLLMQDATTQIKVRNMLYELFKDDPE
ncbi:helix-turn-helix transcriptional regulator [Salicibibacter cibarius]|uniref:Helix-turn-helix transcriptional regulator n=2 Tax=Salicibibacter cibarius TaxID=2743000 RepID=A0A7T6Z658_9BACI|nr:helix-turn-helix transcriptional regulator [Salicibibacter cibarius]